MSYTFGKPRISAFHWAGGHDSEFVYTQWAYYVLRIRYIYVVFMLLGHVEIMLEFMFDSSFFQRCSTFYVKKIDILT